MVTYYWRGQRVERKLSPREIMRLSDALEYLRKHGYVVGARHIRSEYLESNRLVFLCSDFENSGESLSIIRLARGKYRGMPIGYLKMEKSE